MTAKVILLRPWKRELGAPDAVCNSTNSRQVVVDVTWVRLAGSSSASVQHNPGFVTWTWGAEMWEFSLGTVCPTLPWPLLSFFLFQCFTNGFHVLHVSEDFLCYKQLFQVNVIMWKNKCSCWVLPWYLLLFHPCTPRLVLQNNGSQPTTSSPLPILSHLHSGTLYS